MHPVRTAAVLVALIVLGAGATALAQSGERSPTRVGVTLRDGSGKAVGRVVLREKGDDVTITANARGLERGFHGFHVHAVGKCEGPSFTSAEGHFKRGSQDHGRHVGDLPSLYADSDGDARLTTRTDAFSIADLVRGDGSAIMVHGGPDNFANVPDRYDPAPDKETRDTGDAGGRVACGVVE